MVKTRNYFDTLLTLPTAIEEAKKLQYNNKDLEASEKTIFDNALLKDKDASGNEIIKLDEVKDTAALLDNLKKAQAELENEEKSTDLNLSTNGNLLLDEFLKERRNKTIAYQAIEEKKPGEIKKIIDKYQTLQYRRVNRGLEVKKKVLFTALNSIGTEITAQDKEVEKAKKKYEKTISKDKYQNSLEEAVEFKGQVEVIRNALKADLEVGGIGRRILDKVVQINKESANIVYKKDTAATADSWGSIIEVGIENPYSDKRFTHPTYLADGLPYQMKELFALIDKDKLFALIDKKKPSEAKKIKKAFERIANVKVKPETKEDFPYLFTGGNLDAAPADRAAGDFTMVPFNTTVEYDKPTKRTISHGVVKLLVPGNVENIREEWSLYITDILYFMNALFPKDTADLDFSNNNDFLKNGGEYALPFKDSNDTLTSEHVMFWRGRRDNSLGGKTYRELFPSSTFPIDETFPSTKLQLSWAGVKGKSIPEFFWQVYNKPEAVQFNTARDILDKHGNPKEVWKNDYSVYEKKLISWKVGTPLDAFFMSYIERVKDIISGEILINNPTTGAPFAVEKFNKDTGKGLDGEVYWTDFKDVCYELISEVFRTFHSFRQDAERKDYLTLKSDPNMIIPYMTEKTKTELTVFDNTTGVGKIWDKMVDEVCEGKIDNAKGLRAAWINEQDKRTRLNAQEVAKKRELNKIKDAYKTIEDGKFDQLKVQLDNIGRRLDPTRPSSITYQEAMAMHALYWVVKEHEGTGIDAKYVTYMTNLELWEKARNGNLMKYGSLKSMGSNFAERLSAWKEKEGRNLDEKAIRAFFDIIKFELEQAEKSSGLSLEEKADLVAITNYIDTDKQPKLRASQLEIIFAIDTEISQELTDKWNNYGDEKKFKSDSKHLKDIAVIINNLSDKEPFFTELKAYLTGKSGVPNFPSDTATEQDKLNYYYTLDPEHMIGAFAAWKIKTDADEKKKIEEEMKDAKDANNIPLSKDKETGYGDGTKFTDEGIIKYYSEKTGGVKHSYRKQDEKKDGPGSKGKGFWSWDNPSAIITGGCLVVGTGLVLAGIIWWEKLAAWWDGPADAEGNGDDDEENGE